MRDRERRPEGQAVTLVFPRFREQVLAPELAKGCIGLWSLHVTNVVGCYVTRCHCSELCCYRSYQIRSTKNRTEYKNCKTNTNCIRGSDHRDMLGNLLLQMQCDGRSLVRFI